ncbi:hypothetical protein N7326_01890 [Corynebacterium sp. ES2794-CONJ1]|uniref:hypothetical protein n=1 Tax=unclassified Corynebacterium TaxID=2624378 RepID=UPI00216A0C20|nr:MULTISPECIES: hypothetical protein [unclassified Corynebacterium]MCS4489050.1 hypothetical protein [Corynebacterium sp. ES2775-CONJ]MCS4490863.1 hypothetical protein [Corynebacterium sp. ES2715-CONJ3]MCS4531254.1 hypothetical protein [Corynebacterium sp. ES2730-CONJ]MCU9518623.1 hypothetical protein [Corynebacterium sp. ES2794-CONJ1]
MTFSLIQRFDLPPADVGAVLNQEAVDNEIYIPRGTDIPEELATYQHLISRVFAEYRGTSDQMGYIPVIAVNSLRELHPYTSLDRMAAEITVHMHGGEWRTAADADFWELLEELDARGLQWLIIMSESQESFIDLMRDSAAVTNAKTIAGSVDSSAMLSELIRYESEGIAGAIIPSTMRARMGKNTL